jgi:hypothetical protein
LKPLAGTQPHGRTAEIAYCPLGKTKFWKCQNLLPANNYHNQSSCIKPELFLSKYPQNRSYPTQASPTDTKGIHSISTICAANICAVNFLRTTARITFSPSPQANNNVILQHQSAFCLSPEVFDATN